GSQPMYGQPGAPSMPLYGQGAPPGYPPYGQPGAPSMPLYGQPGAPSMPLYGPPGGMPTGWGSPPPPKSRTGLLVGLIATLLVVVIVGTLAAVLLLKPGGGTSAVATATATPTATLAPTTTPTSGPQVLLQDPLTSNANGWANDSHCFFKSDGYHVNDSYICFAPVGPLLNTAVSVKTRQISGSIGEFYGLMVRGKSQGNYYIFGIDSNGKWVFFKVV